MRLALIVMVLIPLADTALLQAADEVLVADDFPDLDPGWGQLTDTQQIKNNKLILTPPANGFHNAVYQGDLFGDVDIRVKVSQAKGAVIRPGGILFWGSGEENNYLAECRADGAFQIARIANGQVLHPFPLQKSDAIKPGLGQTNELRLVTQGNLATFYINGRKVAAIQGNPPEGDGEIGLYAESDDQACAFEFSEFRVLKAPPGATPAPGGGDVGTLLTDDFATLDPAWGIAGDELHVENKKLIVRPEANGTYLALHQGHLFKDADIRVQVSHAQGDVMRPAAIVFWAADRGSFYVAQVGGNGAFGVFRRVNSRWLVPVGRRNSDAVKPGLGQTNELRVVTQGNMATFSINGREVAVFRGFPPVDGGQVGVYAESGDQPSKWEFSEFKVLKAPPMATPIAGGGDDGALLTDDFATLDPAWGIAGDQLRVEKNKLIVRPPPQKTPAVVYQGGLFGDADIRVKVMQVQGDTSLGGGVIFWAVDQDNYYLAAIQSDGTFSISRVMNGQWLFPTPINRKTDAVRLGPGQTNELRLVTQGNLASFSINGRQLLAIHGYPPYGGSLLGLYADAAPSADSPSTWHFSEFRVVKPAAGGSVAGGPSEGGVLFSDDFATLDPAWIPLGAPSDIIHVDDHKLIFAPAKGRTLFPFYQGTTFGDADVRVTVVESQGKTDQQAGIIFWGSNIPAESYLAAIQADGTFGVMRYSGGKLLTPVPWQANDAVNKGVGQANRLRVVTQGKTATIYVNDRKVVSFKGFPPANGSLVGLMAASGDEAYTWQFSSFSVRTVQAESAGEKPSATEPPAATKPDSTAPLVAPPTALPAASTASPAATPESVADAWVTGETTGVPGDEDRLTRKFERRDWKVELVGRRTVNLTDSIGENWGATWPLDTCEPGEYLAVAQTCKDKEKANRNGLCF